MENNVPFKEGLFTLPKSSSEKAYLIGSRCNQCGKIDFPKKSLCFYCMQEDTIEEISLSRKGKIYVSTILRWPKLAPQGHDVPYAFGYVDLPEKVRVLTRLHHKELEKLETGMEVELELIKIDEDEDKSIIGFRFTGSI
jgi:uncharacterized OB-fold protein